MSVLAILELLRSAWRLRSSSSYSARFQHRHGLGAVAVLRAVVLALHHDVGRQVGDAHRRIGLVDVLAAGAGGAVGVDAQVGRIDLDLDGVVHLRIDEHAGERGVAARVRIERRLAHQAVHAVLGAQVPVGVVAGDLERRALDAGHLALGLLEHFDAEALALAVLGVHALEHLRPVLRLGAARAGLDVDEAVVRVERIGEHAAEFQVGHDLPELARRRRRRRRGWRRRSPSRASANSSAASRSVRAMPVSAATMPSSGFFSRPRSWARFGSLQTSGIFERSASTSLRRFCLASKSKIPPQFRRSRVEVGERRGDAVDAFGFHGMRTGIIRQLSPTACASRNNFRRSCPRRSSSARARP